MVLAVRVSRALVLGLDGSEVSLSSTLGKLAQVTPDRVLRQCPFFALKPFAPFRKGAELPATFAQFCEGSELPATLAQLCKSRECFGASAELRESVRAFWRCEVL